MQFCGRLAGAVVMCSICILPAFAGPFVVFPKVRELSSPDGHYVVRDAGREESGSEFVGLFHSLWLTDVPSARSRKLLDYAGVAAVGWSGNYLTITQYLSKKTSRTLVFSAENPEEAYLIDLPTLIRMVPAESRDTLRDNDHVFIEGSSIEGETLRLRVWGYGKHDANGFRWRCDYKLKHGAVSCSDGGKTH